MPTPPKSEEAVLNSVSCPSATACVAVGVNRYAGYRPFVERWNGTSWTVEEFEAPESSGVFWGAEVVTFAGVSCTAANACTAVGSFRQPVGQHKLFAERWNGTTWTAQLPPLPENAKEPKLEAVSCSSATVCTATGNSKNASSVNLPLVERWNGTSWAIQSTPPPNEFKAEGRLSGVSCPVGTTICESAGSYQTTLGSYRPLAERFESSTWTLETPESPVTELPLGVLEDIACPTVTYCMGTGSAGSQPFTETAVRISKAPTVTTSLVVTPTIPKTGSPATTTNGKWNEDPYAFTYQWRRCTVSAPVTCANIAGATSSSYTPVAADLGNKLQVVVTATNLVGSMMAITPGNGPVVEGP